MVTVVALALTSSACIVTSPGHRHGRSHQASRAKCHPSQHWDGHKCRHNGKGHGARKHDGRRR